MRTIVLACLLTVAAWTPAAAGTVTGVSSSPSNAAAGATVSVTVTGINPCGAVHIIYGDGTAITYSISTLPTTQTHVYQNGGTYTIVARGLGNCDGEATTTIQVSGPSPTPRPAGQITALEMTPNPGRAGDPVGFIVSGTGGPCTFTIDYGDGNGQAVRGGFPWRGTHIYAVAQTYRVIVAPEPPCVGTFTELLKIEPRPPTARLGSLTFSPDVGRPGEPVTIVVDGTGVCTYTLDFGDGRTEPRSRELPDRVGHVYRTGGAYTVVAAAEAPCAGSVKARLDVREQQSGVTEVSVTPNPVRQGSPASIQIQGSGSCRVAVDFGDGTAETVEGTLPRRLTHTYQTQGRYVVMVRAEAPCTGERRATVEVIRPPVPALAADQPDASVGALDVDPRPAAVQPRFESALR